LKGVGIPCRQLCKKTAELIEMQFWRLHRVGTGNAQNIRVYTSSLEGGLLRVSCQLKSIGSGGLGKRVSCAKMVGPILVVYMLYDKSSCKELVAFSGS